MIKYYVLLGTKDHIIVDRTKGVLSSNVPKPIALSFCTIDIVYVPKCAAIFRGTHEETRFVEYHWREQTIFLSIGWPGGIFFLRSSNMYGVGSGCVV